MIKEGEEFKDRKLAFLWNILLYTSLLFLIFFVFYGVKTTNGEICTNQNIKNEIDTISNTLLINSNFTFNVLIPTKYDQNIVNQNICFLMKTNSSTYSKVNINDQKVYVNNLSNDYVCAENINLTNKEITINCADCSSNNRLTITNSKDEGLINNDEVISKSATPHYILILNEHCKELYKDMIKLYFLLISLYLLVFLIWRGLEWFEGWLVNG